VASERAVIETIMAMAMAMAMTMTMTMMETLT